MCATHRPQFFADIQASNSSCQHKDTWAGTFTCWAPAGPCLPFLLELVELNREAGFADVPVFWVELPALGCCSCACTLQECSRYDRTLLLYTHILFILLACF